MWHQWFNHNFTKPWEYFLCAMKKRHFGVNNVCNICTRIRCLQNSIRCLCMWYSPKWRRGDVEETNCWKVVIFVFFAHKKYSRSFVKLRLNHWSQMDYFIDVLATFLCVDRGNILTVYGRVRELSECIKNILICCPKMNGSLTGLERHEGE